MPPVILASTSVYRRALMDRLGIPYVAMSPACDEEAIKRTLGELAPDAYALRLAKAKAASIADVHSGAVVIGSDQVCVCDGMILHKPGTPERAVEHLQRLSGMTHHLLTAVCIRHGMQEQCHVESVALTMRLLDRTALARYVAADKPLDCAGAYKLEQRGISLFERIDARDHDSIVGLPLLWLTGRLAAMGFQIP